MCSIFRGGDGHWRVGRKAGPVTRLKTLHSRGTGGHWGELLVTRRAWKGSGMWTPLNTLHFRGERGMIQEGGVVRTGSENDAPFYVQYTRCYQGHGGFGHEDRVYRRAGWGQGSPGQIRTTMSVK